MNGRSAVTLKEALMQAYRSDVIVVRSGGDIATGIIQKFWRAGFRVAVLETAAPLTIRRTVALSTAVRHGSHRVEDMCAVLANNAASCFGLWSAGRIPVLVDPGMQSLGLLRPVALVDAIIAKRNTGMRRDLAPLTVALGPGFTAPDDVDCVVETMRGHHLGRLITQGAALPNTGVPGPLGGKAAERVIHAPVAGVVRHARVLGDRVAKDDIIFYIDDTPVRSRLNGTVRGLIEEGTEARKGLKCADVDPRAEEDIDCSTISDKARALGGAALEACLMLAAQRGIALEHGRRKSLLVRRGAASSQSKNGQANCLA